MTSSAYWSEYFERLENKSQNPADRFVEAVVRQVREAGWRDMERFFSIGGAKMAPTLKFNHSTMNDAGRRQFGTRLNEVLLTYDDALWFESLSRSFTKYSSREVGYSLEILIRQPDQLNGLSPPVSLDVGEELFAYAERIGQDFYNGRMWAGCSHPMDWAVTPLTHSPSAWLSLEPCSGSIYPTLTHPNWQGYLPNELRYLTEKKFPSRKVRPTCLMQDGRKVRIMFDHI